MPLILPMRKIDEILRNKAKITLNNGETYIGYGDCMIYLPLNDDTEEEDEFLRFVVSGDRRLKKYEDLYLLDEDIQDFEILS